MNKIETYINEGRWTEFLLALPLDTAKGFQFPSVKAMDSCRVMAYRFNTNPDHPRCYKININYPSLIFTITASSK